MGGVVYGDNAGGNECAGEIVVNHYGVIFRRDKLGVATP